MANEGGDHSVSLMHTVLRMLDSLSSNGSASYDSIINILSLLCIASILTRNQSSATSQALAPAPAAAPVNPLHKLLGDLAKGDGGPSPDMLMSLLPLLNNPQLKSKINPSTISTVLGIVNSLGGSGNGEKHESAKQEKTEKDVKDVKKESPAAAVTTLMSPLNESEATPPATPPATIEAVEPAIPEMNDADKRHVSRYLNWKSSF